MSAPGTPGRRRDLKHQPIFLRKTYHMISNCPPSIASWSETGDSFVVKNTQDFASKVIPCFFKHSNFSSFVRQLNFYGFRKVKAESILNTGNETKSWEFRHDKFIRGQPGLLSEIRRASGYANSEPSIPQEVDELKAEVASLRSQVEVLTSTARDLTALVNTFVRERNSASSGLPITPLTELSVEPLEALALKQSCADPLDHDPADLMIQTGGSLDGSGFMGVSNGRSQRRLRSPRGSMRPMANAFVSSSPRQSSGRSVKVSLGKGSSGCRRSSSSRASSSASTSSAYTSSPSHLYHGESFSNGSSMTEDEDEEDDDEFSMMESAEAARAIQEAQRRHAEQEQRQLEQQQQQEAAQLMSSCGDNGAAVVPQQQPQGVEMEVGGGGHDCDMDGGLDNQEFAESLRAFFPLDEDVPDDSNSRAFQSMLLKPYVDDSKMGHEGGSATTSCAASSSSSSPDRKPDSMSGLLMGPGESAVGGGGSAWDASEDDVPLEVKMGAIFDSVPAPPAPPVLSASSSSSSYEPPSGAGQVGQNGSYLLPGLGTVLQPVMEPQPIMPQAQHQGPPRQKRKLSHLEEEAAMFAAAGASQGVC